MPTIAATAALVLASSASAPLPDGYWSGDQAQVILDKTLTVRLAPELSPLSDNERIAVRELLAAGERMHVLYLEQLHPQALAAREELIRLHENHPSNATRDLLTLFRLFKGPVATTLDNARVPFLPVDALRPGRNVYPPDITREEIDLFLRAHPRSGLLDTRSVVRRATAENLDRDLAALKRYPALDLLQPGLREHLQQVRKAPHRNYLYALPYSIAYADELMAVYGHLRAAAAAMRTEDTDFAAYLDNRARDLLSNDYESGDASWVRGEFGDLNAQIGSFETYDDEFAGVKSFFSLSVLVRDRERSAALAKAIERIQDIENALPYEQHKTLRNDIPAGVYDVIADFGQARGTNTASILPNDPAHARKHGRIILLRHNILTNETLFRDTKAAWDAAVAPEFADHLTLDSNFQRTLWHEIGHYLGVSVDKQGRALGAALREYADLMEEMKADLVSLHAAPALRDAGYYSDDALRALYASGVNRTLQSVKPRRDQPYQTMQLMQMNWLLEHGVLVFDDGVLRIDYAKFHDAVRALLREVLAIQYAGDPVRARAFVERYARWDDALHGMIAKRMREAAKYRYRLVQYQALGE